MPLLRAKVLLLGDQKVGKTALSSVFTSNGSNFPKNYVMTSNVEFSVKIVQIPDSEDAVELYLFDNAGNPVAEDLIVESWQSASMVALVYDVTNEASFKNLSKWLSMVHSVLEGRVLPGVVIANKSDLSDLAVVPPAQGAEFAQMNNLAFFETSSLQNAGVDAPFYYLAAQFHKMFQEKVEMIANTTN